MENNPNMTVKQLKEILEILPDDMPVIIPVIDYEDPNVIEGFRYVRTAGVLYCGHEEECRIVVINSSSGGLDISSQLKNRKKYRADQTIYCERVLF